jgi:hypothetical protein
MIGTKVLHRTTGSVSRDCLKVNRRVTVENLLCSIYGAYLHFNRVDGYRDFPGADPL